MDLTIHTYGYIDAIYYVMNAIAMFRNSGFFSNTITTVSVLVTLYYGTIIALNGAVARRYIIKIIGMLVLINTLLLPKTSMIIKDHVSKKMYNVDNIPLIFALPVGMMEEFGHLLTVGFEQVFAPIEQAVNPNNPVFSYYNYGMLFGARLKKELASIRMKNPEFINNMNAFMKQCIVTPAMIGVQFTKEELVSVPDVWKLVSERAGDIILVDLYRDAQLERVTCEDAVPYFEQYFTKEEERIITKYHESDFSYGVNEQSYNKPTPLGVLFKRNIELVYGCHYSASNALRQQMMMNVIRDYTDRASNYASSRMKMQQESSWLLSSETASYFIPMTLVILKCILYASFIFIAPLMLFNNGMHRFTQYLTAVASLQLWPSLNAVINMIMGTYSGVARNSDMIINYSTSSSINHHVDTIVTVAAGMQCLVPFIAVPIMQGGLSGITHLAGSIIGSIQSNAGMVGTERATGNISLDNISTNNTQRSMRSGYKLDQNTQYVDQAIIAQLSDGTQERINPDGSKIYTGGSGLTDSTGIASYRMEDTHHAQVNEGINQAESLHKQDMQAYSEAKATSFNQQKNYLKHIAQQESAGHTYNYDQLGEEGKALNMGISYAKNLHDNHNYDWDQAAEAALTTSLEGSKGFKVFGTGATASIRADGKLSATNANKQSIGESHQITNDQNISDTYSQISRALSSESFAENNSIDKSYSNDVRHSEEEVSRLEHNMSMSKQKVDDWHEARNIITSKGATVSKDMTEDLVNRCMVEWGDGNKQEIFRKVQKRHPDVLAVWNKMQKEDNYVSGVLSKIEKGHQDVAYKNNSQLDGFRTEKEKILTKTNESYGEKVEEASEVKTSEVETNIALNKQKTKDEIELKKGQHTEMYGSANNENKDKAGEIQKRVDKSENIRKYTSLGGLIGGQQKTDKNSIIDKEAYDKKYEEQSKKLEEEREKLKGKLQEVK